jgi:type II pantothenate kinase
MASHDRKPSLTDRTNDEDGGALGRTRTNTSVIDSLSHPGSVRINFQGAYIIDEEDSSISSSSDSPIIEPEDDYGFEEPVGETRSRRYTKEIRLPNHKGRVSHLAVDVSYSSLT